MLWLDRGCFHDRQVMPRTAAVELEHRIMESSQVVILADGEVGDFGVRQEAINVLNLIEGKLTFHPLKEDKARTCEQYPGDCQQSRFTVRQGIGPIMLGVPSSDPIRQ